MSGTRRRLRELPRWTRCVLSTDASRIVRPTCSWFPTVYPTDESGPAPLGGTGRDPDRHRDLVSHSMNIVTSMSRRAHCSPTPRHPVASQSGHRYVGALQGRLDEVTRQLSGGDRGLRHAARRDDGGAAAGVGPPHRSGDRQRRCRTRPTAPAATATGGAAGWQRHRARTDVRDYQRAGATIKAQVASTWPSWTPLRHELLEVTCWQGFGYRHDRG